jgi:hypothetical protein
MFRRAQAFARKKYGVSLPEYTGANTLTLISNDDAFDVDVVNAFKNNNIRKIRAWLNTKPKSLSESFQTEVLVPWLFAAIQNQKHLEIVNRLLTLPNNRFEETDVSLAGYLFFYAVKETSIDVVDFLLRREHLPPRFDWFSIPTLIKDDGVPFMNALFQREHWKDVALDDMLESMSEGLRPAVIQTILDLVRTNWTTDLEKALKRVLKDMYLKGPEDAFNVLLSHVPPSIQSWWESGYWAHHMDT